MKIESILSKEGERKRERERGRNKKKIVVL
jgi:hypothetical protein